LLIGYYKYYNFFISTANTLFETNFSLEAIFLPLAISFYTFQQIAYLVDAYRGETNDYNLLQYAVFVSVFPQLIAGPIVHHQEVLPQLRQKTVDRPVEMDVSIGISIFCIGLFKKVIIADNFALIASPVFMAGEQGAALGFFDAWRGAFSYSFQLYFDFSGYSDMAIGLGRMFGIHLPLNFHSPYRATGIIEFWRRWHITLSRFLKYYLYVPLGGNRKGRFRRYVNIMVTMLLGGLWHGAGWTFVIWGGMHGFMLIVNHMFRFFRKRPLQNLWSTTLLRFFTFVCVTIAWVFFRSETFSGAATVLKGMRNLPHTLQGRIGPLESALQVIGFEFNGPWITASDYQSVFGLLFWLFVIWFWPNTQEWLANFKPALNAHEFIKPDEIPSFFHVIKWQPVAVWGAVAAFIGLASILHLSQPTEFLYFQF
jgi:D-alanyl-lipoteichoic acid acyltransferase DltB (MBOAT superfamily)